MRERSKDRHKEADNKEREGSSLVVVYSLIDSVICYFLVLLGIQLLSECTSRTIVNIHIQSHFLPLCESELLFFQNNNQHKHHKQLKSIQAAVPSD